MLQNDIDRSVATERADTCADFIQDNAQRIDIAALSARIPLGLLWGDIERRAQPCSTQRCCGGIEQLDYTKVGKNRRSYRVVPSIASVE
jgi:hypothetical protein